MDLRKFYHDTDKLFLTSNLQVLHSYLRSFLIRFIITHHIHVAGPTSFAPIIEMAMTIVEQSGGQYHVLLIIADGQVIL